MATLQSLFARGLHLIDNAQHRIYATRKTRLLGGLRGRVVEIGPGTGLNIPYLNRSVAYTGLEPNRHLHTAVRAQLRQQHIQGAVHAAPIEADALPPNSADAVISTLVLCSVPDVAAALTSIRRILRPGGRFVFIEHIAAPDATWSRAVQDGVTPVWHRCFDGCHPNRRTDRFIHEAGFASVAMEHFEIGVPVVRPHCAGFATA